MAKHSALRGKNDTEGAVLSRMWEMKESLR